MSYTQENRLLGITTPLGDDDLMLAGFAGDEGISRLFRFELDLRSARESIDFPEIAGKTVTVRLTLADGGNRYFNGVISRLCQAGRERDLVVYRAEMVPWLWFLTQTSNCRIFQRKTVPDIVRQIFTDLNFTDYRLQLFGIYAEREYCVQYRETAFNFISRLLEEEGIFFFFEHQAGSHILILADDPAAHKACPGQERARYDVASGGMRDDDAVMEWSVSHAIHPGTYSQADYNFEQSTQPLRADVKGPNSFELFDFQPGEYKERSAGDSLVRTRLQELEATSLTGQGSSDCRAFSSGFRFELTKRDEMNEDWVLTSIHHTARQPGDFRSGSSAGDAYYRNDFNCIPHTTPFRPARLTPHPLVQGAQTAVVVGPAGEEIFVDQYGRVKVQFHWDREGANDENSSCWMRVAQTWAGKGWGAMFVPRIGQEVVVDFLEGDPDQPIVTGSLYNAGQIPPYRLPEHKTRSTLRSNSSKGSSGFNELRFEDKKNGEQVYIHAERDMDIRVGNDEHRTVGRDAHFIVDRDRYEHIKSASHSMVDANRIQKIGGDLHLNISGNQAAKLGGAYALQVAGDVTEVFSQNHSEKTSMGIYLKAGMGVVIEASVGVTLKCGSSSIVVDTAGVTIAGQLVVIEGQKTLINSGPGSPPATGSTGTVISPSEPKEPVECE